MSDLYEADIVLWSERQAELLRRRADAVGFRTDAVARYVPSMRQRIDLDRIYRMAVRALPETVDGLPPLPVPDVCPITLDELLSEP